MSLATGTSLKVAAMSTNGSVAQPNPSRSARSAKMCMFLDDHQRYDMIACGMATIRKEVSPSEDIRRMARKLKAINPGLIACKKE